MVTPLRQSHLALVLILAEHRLLKRPCAIKLIRPDKADDSNALVRFEREVRITAKLSHPNTIDIYDYGRTEDGTFFYVMESAAYRKYGTNDFKMLQP